MVSKHAFLFDAIKKNCLKTLSTLMNSGIDVNLCDKCNKPPLQFAMDCNADKEIVMQIISAGANVNASNIHDTTPLMYAVQRGYTTEVILLLINSGAKVNAIDKWGRTPIMFTTCVKCEKNTCRNEENVIALLNNGANIKHKDCGGNTILHLEICSYLINLFFTYGVCIDSKDNGGDTPLMTHVLRANSKKVCTLLSLGADPNCQDRDLNTPLYNTSDDNIINILLYHGAVVDTKNINNKNPLNVLFERDWTDSLLAVIKHLLLYEVEIINKLLVDGECCYNSIQLKLEECKSELNEMKKTKMTKNLTFYDFCIQKKTKACKFVNISESLYLYNNSEIKEVFPNYNNIIIMKMKYNKIEKYKNDMLKNLEKVLIHPLRCKDSSCTGLNYDCLSYIGRFLNNKQLYDLLCASIK